MEERTTILQSTVYDRLMKLNILPHAYEEWSDYRREVSSFILSNTRKDSSVLIVGAGACNDFDLSLLCTHFCSITLADIDLSSMQSGVKKQNPDISKITLKKADIIGIDERSIRRFSSEMEYLASCGKKELTDDYLNAVRKLFSDRTPDPIYDCACFDYVICIGVHSQLLSIFPRIARVFSRAGLVDIERIESYISSMNALIMPMINKKLFDMAREGAIFGLETERIGTPGAIEGSKQAADDLLKNENVKIENEISIIWPLVLNSHAYRISILYAEKIKSTL